MTSTTPPWRQEDATALLVLADGTVIEGRGLGAAGSAVGEVCFNTALTGYQEILTDPSYAGQIVTFTFPHIGNVGANDEDIEDLTPAARAGAVGAVFKSRHHQPLQLPLGDPPRRLAEAARHGRHGRHRHPGADGADPRKGVPNAVIAHAADGRFDIDDLKRRAAAWPGLVGLDLAKEVTSGQSLDLARDAVGLERRLRPAGRAVDATWWRSTTASSATFCGCLPGSAPR